MRKVILLLAGLLIGTQAFSQIDTIFIENFDPPSGPDSVTNSVLAGIGVITPWNDTNLVKVSPPFSYHVQGSQTGSTVVFETDAFSTVGKPFVKLQFKQIAKLLLPNSAYLEISIDNGANWNYLNANQYQGNDGLFKNAGYFNAGSHQTTAAKPWKPFIDAAIPDNTWWLTEEFDLTGVASDTSVSPFVGYANVKIRFRADFNFKNALNAFSAGWFVDDVVVTGAPCELSSPSISFDFNPIPCYPNKPEGKIVRDPSNTYPIGVLSFDTASIYDTGIDSVAITYRVNNGPWITQNMPETSTNSNEFKADLNNLFLNDVVDYYVEAWDLSCSKNVARDPQQFANPNYYTFEVDSALPAKCGSPYCGTLPDLINPDTLWVEDFEDPGKWVPGSGAGNTNTTHRGGFPGYPDYYWKIAPATSDGFGWSIRQGATGSPFTGPTVDHTFNSSGGTYLYMEVSQGGVPSITRLTTPCISLINTDPCLALEFYYHMFGADIGKLVIDIDTGADQSAYWNGYFKIEGEQQTATTDPWRRAVVSLEPFAGKIINIRIRGVKDQSGNAGDIAIDDLRIFEPDPVELEVLNTSFPVNGYCSYSSTTDVKVSIRNNGCLITGGIPIAFEVFRNGVGQGIQTDVLANANLALGEDTIDYIFTPKANLSQLGNYEIKVWVNAPNDADRSNDTATGPAIQHNPTISNFPYIEDFENGVPFTQNLNNSDITFTDGLDPNFFWQVGEGLTPSLNTGPYSGHYWGGKYLYTESNSALGGVSTYFRTLCVDLTGMTKPTLDFMYHNYTGGINGIVIQVSKELEDYNTWTTLAGSNTPGTQNDVLDEWKLKRVDLSSYLNQKIKIRFRATRNNTSTDRTDFAIDNLVIHDPLASDGGAFSLTAPSKKGTNDTMQVPQVLVANYGKNALTSYRVNIKVTPLCGPNQGQSVVYFKDFTTTIQPGEISGTLNFGAAAGVKWPVGENDVQVYTSNINGDTRSFNDTITKHIFALGAYDIATAPDDTGYFTNFDICAYASDGFLPGGPGLLQWEFGTPTYGINGAHSGPNAWGISLDKEFVPGTEERLVVPIFDGFDTVVNATIKFWHNFNFNDNIGGTLEFQSGGQYQALGSQILAANLGKNWWLSAYGDPSHPLFGGTPAWKGPSGNKYIESTYPLYMFNNQNAAKLVARFIFKSSSSASVAGNPGWAIDDFEIYIPPQNSVSPINARLKNPLPFPGDDQNIQFTVQNTGEKIVTEFKATIFIDGIQIGSTQLYQTPGTGLQAFTKGKKRTFDFSSPWPGNQVTSGVHEMCIITNRPNDKQDNKHEDDTLCVNIYVLQEIDMTAGHDSSYCEGFEGNNPGHNEWITTNTDAFRLNPYTGQPLTSWERGKPSTPELTSAYKGSNVWMTDLDNDYDTLDASALYTPIFIVDSGQTFKIDFWHWFQTERYHDGGNVEVTFDNGQTWYPFGYAVKGKDNWFNTPFVTSLDVIRGGWTDTSGTWQHAYHTLSFNTDVKAVFRFRFGADYSLEYNGWAIDEFCFFKLDSAAQSVIGEGEYELPDQIVMGDLSPNPATDFAELNFYFPTPNGLEVSVYNVIGQRMQAFEENYHEGMNQLRFNTSTWKNGVYLINLRYEGQTLTKKLIVHH